MYAIRSYYAGAAEALAVKAYRLVHTEGIAAAEALRRSYNFV